MQQEEVEQAGRDNDFQATAHDLYHTTQLMEWAIYLNSSMGVYHPPHIGNLGGPGIGCSFLD